MKTLLILIIGFGLILTSFADSTTAPAPALMFSRHYTISTETFVSHLKQLAPPKAGESDQELLLRYIEQQHIDLPVPSSIFLDEKGGRLFVRTTKPSQDKIEKLVVKIVNSK